jgi:large subunit ribosomal protein L30
MKLKLTLKRSTIGRLTNQKATAQALGLRKLHQSVVHEVTPQLQGMINRIQHLIDIEEVNE